MLLAEQFYKEAPLCPAVQHSVQECNSNGVCIIFICHYNHHHYHDMLSVWQSVCNMNDNSSYWSCSSMKHLIISCRERQLEFKKAPDVGKTAFKTPLCCFLELAAYREIAAIWQPNIFRCFCYVLAPISVSWTPKEDSKFHPGLPCGPLVSIKNIHGSQYLPY